MPLQNRVTPTSEIIADVARGTLMGNRGILHDAGRRLGRRAGVTRTGSVAGSRSKAASAG
jgi:hypothetical protein